MRKTKLSETEQLKLMTCLEPLDLCPIIRPASKNRTAASPLPPCKAKTTDWWAGAIKTNERQAGKAEIPRAFMAIAIEKLPTGETRQNLIARALTGLITLQR
jgi:hypothetical protein